MSVFHIGNYVVNKNRIGRGSFSKIYKGYHKDTKQVVAVKKIEVDNIKKISKNIKREIIVMKKLKHNNIVELYDVIYDYEDNYIYLIMEYCSKGDLNKFLDRRPLKEKYARRYFRQLRDGLKYLLDNNVMHRDLKPHNILLTENNILKLSDFGFARYFESNTLVETLCGSPMYMAPEIMKYKRYTNKSDLWSVGIILYESLTGKTPFNAKTFYDLIKHIEKKKIKIPPNIQLSDDCVELIYSLLKKNPENRISWEQFVYHKWFDEEQIQYENKLLEISVTQSFSKMNTLIENRKKQSIQENIDSIEISNKSISSSNSSSTKNVELSINLLFEYSDDELEQSDELDYVLVNNETSSRPSSGQSSRPSSGQSSRPSQGQSSRPSSGLSKLSSRSKPISIPFDMKEDHFSNESPQFNSLKDGSFIIVNPSPQRIARSDGSPSLMNNVRGYINSSISLLRDSFNYISGNNSI